MNPQLIRLCAETLGIKPEMLGPESNADNVDGWDSLKHWEIINAVEICFGFEFSMDEASAFKNLGEIDACLKSKGIGSA